MGKYSSEAKSESPMTIRRTFFFESAGSAVDMPALAGGAKELRKVPS